MKIISQEKYYVLKGLIELIKFYEEIMRTIEATALVITDEVDESGQTLFGGHTADILWGSRDLDDGLRVMGISVEKKKKETKKEIEEVIDKKDGE